VYEDAVACHVPQPPAPTDDRNQPGASAADKAAYVAQREKFISETIKELARSDGNHSNNPLDWRHLTLQIKFSVAGQWQMGVDWGGLTKAFVKFMSECLFDTDLPCTLFVPMGKDDDVDGLPPVSELWRMKTDSELAAIPSWEKRMRFVGRFVGYCIWTGETAELPMLPSVYAFLLDKHIQWRDLMLDNPSTYKGYLDLLKMPADEVEYIYYTMAVDNPGGGEFELIDGGAGVDVTGANRHDFVQAAAMAKMIRLHEAGLAAIMQGFMDVIDYDTLQYIQSQEIAACELRAMVCGVAEVDVADLQQKTLYKNCDMGAQK
jgi:hypothetical protein